MAIVPCCVGNAPITDRDGVIRSGSLPFTERRALCKDETLGKLYILRGNIVDGRMARLQDTLCSPSVCNDNLVEDDLNMFIALLETRWARVVPNGLLPWLRLRTPALTHSLSSAF